MPNNPILEELYAVRSQLQAEHGDRLVEYLHGEFERLRAGGHPIAHIEQRSLRRAGAGTSGALAGDARPAPPDER